MSNMNCPKCGFQQEESEECASCGIIFARYVAPEEPDAPSGILPAGERSTEPAEQASPGLFRRVYRVARWVALGAVLLVLFLILRPATPPEVDSDPGSAQRVESMFRGLASAEQQGRPYTMVMSEADLNHLIQSSLEAARNPPRQGITDVQRRAANKATGGMLAKIPSQIGGAPAGAGAVPPPPPTAPANQMQPTLAEIQSTVRDMRINLTDDRVRVYFLFELAGKDMSLELEGRLLVRDGYLRLEPTAGRLGSFPIPGFTLDNAVRRLFDSPENKEKFHLGAGIRDIRIEGGRLIVERR